MKKSSKFLILLGFIALVFFSFCILTFATDVWDGTVSGEAPTQNARGYYLCKNGKDLAWAAKQVNSGYTNLKIMLTDDIYLNDIELDEYENVWTPIGSVERKFEGFFDGNNHIIYGLYINNNEKYQGLFGYLSGADVKGVKLYYVSVSAGQYVGGICGYAASGTVVSNCVVSGDIYSSGGDCGGISGYGRIEVKFSCCGVKGEVSSDGNRVAGISGCIANNTVIEKCYNNASVSSSGKFVGGISGTSSGSTVRSCYNTGDISGATRVGGIVGNNVGDVYVSYNCGNITSPKEYGAVCGFNSIAEVKNCYYRENSCVAGDQYAIEKTVEQLKRYSIIVALNKNGGDFIIDYQDENDGYPVLSWMLESDVWTRGVKKPSLYTDGQTYLITSAEELAWFAGLVNGTLDDTAQDQSAKAILTKSIILNLGEYDEEYSNIWTPIGSGGAEFFGEFEGNGKTVSGVAVGSGENVGLFGSVRSGATVRNLKIDKSYICGQNAGGVAGDNLGTISEIEVSYSTIIGQTVSGGIVGENEGTLNECAFCNSTVSSQTKCGGITGVNSGEISACYNTSAVNSASYVGGIAGDNRGSISSCFNCAEVTATGNYCGGIAGYCVNATVTKCYNTGSISGKSAVGGIVGYARYGELTVCYDVGEVAGTGSFAAVCPNSVNANISCVYYDSQRITASDSNATALNTTQMSGSTALSRLEGFSRSDWSTTADGNYFYYYPQLSAVSTSGIFNFYYDCVESVKFLKYEYHCRVDINEQSSYFSSLKTACEAIGDRTAVIYVFENMTFSDKATVNGNITVCAENSNVTLKRSSDYTGGLFEVNGTLIFGDKKDDRIVTFDGSLEAVTVCDSLVEVNGTGTFILSNAILKNNTSSEGAAVYNCGNTQLLGGEITGCVSFSNGAALYNKSDALIDGTLIHHNTSFSGGGAVCNDSGNCECVISSGRIYQNSASDGGAIYAVSGKTVIEGAEIYSNNAANGGAVYVLSGTVESKGGVIYDNSADLGNAVYNAGGVFAMGESGYIDQSNDVYLPTGKTVTMTSKLDSSDICLNITPQTYEKDVRVVDGSFAAANYKRVYINDYQTQNWHINSSGHLLTDEVVEVALVSILGVHSVYYTSLEEAFDDIGENDAIITLVGDVSVNRTLVVRSNVTILSDSEQRTALCSEQLNGPMFDVLADASLVLGDNVNKEKNDILFFDASMHTSSELIKVEQGGTLDIYNGCVIRDMTSDTFSAVDICGTMNIYGGKIIDNNCAFGTLNVRDNARLYLYGGHFSNENVSVYKTGEMYFHENASLGDNVVLIDSGVINLDSDYSSDVQIAVIKFDRYVLGTLCVSTELDKTYYKNLFAVEDGCYYLDDEMRLCADMLEMKPTAALLLNRENNYIYGIDVDVNTAENISSQFVNKNIIVLDEEGNIIDITDLCGTKYRVCLADSNGDIYDQVYVLVYGDVNCDGSVDGEDSVFVNMISYGFLNVDDILIREAADVNHDGIIDLSDAWMLEDAGLFNNSILQKSGG